MRTYKTIVSRMWLVVLITLFSSCNKYNHVYMDSLKGNVKSVVVEIYDVDFDQGKIVKDNLREKFIKTFDIKGYTTLCECYIGETELRFSSSLNANDDRSIIESTLKFSDTDISKSIYRMKNNRPISMKFYRNDKLQGEMIYYTEDNKLFVGIAKNTDGKIVERAIVVLQKGNNVTDIVFSDETNTIRGTYFDRKSFKIVRTLNKDENGERILEYAYNDSGFLEKSINCYFDEIAGVLSLESSKIFYYKYEIDSKNNWIKCIVYEEGSNNPVIIKERKITYY